MPTAAVGVMLHLHEGATITPHVYGAENRATLRIGSGSAADRPR